MNTLILLAYFLSFTFQTLGKSCKRSSPQADGDSDTDDDCSSSSSSSLASSAMASSTSPAPSLAETTPPSSPTSFNSPDPALNGPPPPHHKTLDTTTLIALILGLLVFLLLIVIGLLLLRRRRRKRTNQVLENSLERGSTPLMDQKRDPAKPGAASGEKGQSIIISPPPSTSESESRTSSHTTRLRRAVMDVLTKSMVASSSNVSPNMSEARQGVLVTVPSGSQTRSASSSLHASLTQSSGSVSQISSPVSIAGNVGNEAINEIDEERRPPPPAYDSLTGQ